MEKSWELKLMKRIQKYAQNPKDVQSMTEKLLEIMSEGRSSLHWEKVNYLLRQCFQADPYSQQNQCKLVCFISMLKSIVLKTFPHQAQNKISSCMLMIYSTKIQQLSFENLPSIMFGFELSSIMYEVIQGGKITLPQFYRFAFKSIQHLAQTITHFQPTNQVKPQNESDYFVRVVELVGKFISIHNVKHNRNLTIVNEIKQVCGQFAKVHGDEKLNDLVRESLQLENRTDMDEEENKIIQVKQLTPKLIESDPMLEVKKLRKKKAKLHKKISADVRKNTLNKLQQNQAILDVKKERIKRTMKKEQFILQKQTQEAKKLNSKVKKVKQIQKQMKKSKK